MTSEQEIKKLRSERAKLNAKLKWSKYKTLEERRKATEKFRSARWPKDLSTEELQSK